ncbi:MAG: protein kinase [Myxococcaceae bacterium]
MLAERYELIRFIANGGMGEVWEAEDRSLKERVALKTIRSDALNEETLERFRREVKLARKVSHRNVCRVFEFGEHRAEDGRSISFLTMELLVGTPLDAVLRQRGKLPPDEALPLLEQMAAALDAAHAEGIVHRDFKSPNVFVVQGTTSSRVVVTDFGIARALSDDARVTVDPTQMIGTPGYMAPEQVEGSTVGPAADLYALGVVAFELVTGQLPFNAPSAMAMALMRLREPARRLADVEPALDPKWDAAVSRALARRPDDRFPSAAAFVDALRGSSAVSPPVALAATPPPARGSSRLWVALGAAGLVIASGAAILSRGNHATHAAITRGGTLRASTAVPGARFQPDLTGFSTPGIAAAHVYERLGHAGLVSRTMNANEAHFRLAGPRMFQPHPCWPGGRARAATVDDLAVSLKPLIQPGTTELKVVGDEVVLTGVPGEELEMSLGSIPFQPAMAGDCSAEAQTVASGTGPFRLERTVGPDRFELTRDDSNRAPGDQGPPYVDHLSLICAQSALAMVPQLKTGEVHLVEVPRSEWSDFFVDPQDRHPKLKPPFDALPLKVATMELPGTALVVLSINPLKPDSPLLDPHIRRAIAVGINRDAIAKLHERKLIPIGRLMPAGSAGAAPVLDETLDYRPDEARRLIASATADAGTRPLLLGYLSGYQQMLEEIARELQSEGLKVNTAEFSVGTDPEPFDMLLNVVGGQPDALPTLLAAAWGTPQLTPKSRALLDRMGGQNYATRVQQYANVERELLTELPLIPLASTSPHAPIRLYLHRPEVKGFADEDTHQVLDNGQLFLGVHLETEPR